MNTNSRPTFSRLKAERMKRGLTQRDFDLHPATVSKLENGALAMTDYYAERLCVPFGVPPATVRSWAKKDMGVPAVVEPAEERQAEAVAR